MLSCGWLWLYFGAFLMLAELFMPGFVIFFFGLSAVTVGLLRFLVGDAFSAAWQLASFSLLSLAYLLLLRRWVTGIFSGFSSTSKTDFGHESLGRLGKVTEPIAPPKTGRVLIGDAEWTAEASAPVAAGTDVKVVAQHNLTMVVEAV